MSDDPVVNSETRSTVTRARRLPIIFRLMLQGYDQASIAHEVGGDVQVVIGEIATIEALQREWLDLEKVRTGIAFELDELRWRLLDEIDNNEVVSTKPGVRLEYYKQLTFVEKQKAELYGLNGPTINVNNQGRLMDLVMELKKIGSPEIINVTPEPGTEGNRLEGDGLYALSGSETAAGEL